MCQMEYIREDHGSFGFFHYEIFIFLCCGMIIQYLISNMQLIQAFFKVPQPTSWREDSLLFTKIQAIIVSQRIPFQILSASQAQIKLMIELKNKAANERAIASFWTFTQAEYLQVTVQSCLEASQAVLLDPPPKMKELIRQMNSASYGLYFTDQSRQTKISFRQRYPFQTTKSYLSSYIRELYIQISVQFRKWAVLLKLIPGVQEISCKKLADTLVRLKLLKEQFEFARQQRKKHTSSYAFTNNSIKVVSQSLQLINLCIGKLKAYAWQAKIDIARSHKLYQQSSNLILEAIKKQRQSLSKYIVKPIMIEDIDNEQDIDEGGFSQIKLGTYAFTQLLTLNSNTINPLPLLMPTQCNGEGDSGVKRKALVRKLPKNQVDFSHLNEFELLKFLRNKKDNHIADYYLSNSSQEQYNKGIYMQYYHSNLVKAYSVLKEIQLLRICRQILEGIYFLWQNRILHRDLKELNILIDQYGNAKLIDFGSASGFASNANGQFKAFSNKLMATRGYFYSYKDIPIAGIAKKFTLEEYQQAQSFDMYSFGQILNNLFCLNNIQDSLVHRQLSYLARRCQEINPQDRIYPQQALCYLKQIISLHVQQNSILAEEVKANSPSSGQKKSTKSTSQQ